jgi:hypothetical protein
VVVRQLTGNPEWRLTDEQLPKYVYKRRHKSWRAQVRVGRELQISQSFEDIAAACDAALEFLN